jgi:uncharacterized protein (TIGR02266 family)
MKKSAAVPSLLVDGELEHAEAQLAHAEAELAGLEARQREAAGQAALEAAKVAQRMATLRAQLGEEAQEGGGVARLHGGTALVVPALEPLRQRSLRARTEALEARRQVSHEVEAALRGFHDGLARALADAQALEAEVVRAREHARARASERAAETEQAARRAAAARAHEAARRAAAEARRREQRRVALQASVDPRSDSNLFTGFSGDIREGGVFVATVQALPRGTPVELTVTLPEGRALHASGVVRWTRELNERQPEMMPGLGVQFTALLPEVAEALRGFLGVREPLFFPL